MAIRRPASELLRPEARPAHVSGVVSSLVDEAASARMSLAHAAWVAWHRGNGDRERAHTVYVNVRRPRRAGDAPIVVVGVDSHSFMSDVTTNREIYLLRLANVGFEASALEVRLARPRGGARGRKGHAEPVVPAPEPLTEEERRHIQELVGRLPESLRPNASKALEKSILRNRHR